MTETFTISDSPLAQQMAETGSVEIRFIRQSLVGVLGIPCALVVVVFMVGYITREIGGAEFIFGSAVVPAVIFAIGWVITRQNEGKDLLLEEHGLTTPKGQFIHWRDIEKASIARPARGVPFLQLLITEPAWEAFLANESAIGRGFNLFNYAFTRKRGIYLSTYWEADKAEVANLIDHMVTRTRNSSSTQFG